nr:hypothetical protein [Candidatus Hydrogenedentota bacterium]
ELRDEVSEGERWQCYAEVRCDAKASSGVALAVGLYDATGKKHIVQRRVPIADVAGADYKTIDLGTHALAPGMYFWAAPVNNPDEVDAIYVDRFYLLRKR